MSTTSWRVGFCLGLAIASSLAPAWGCVKRRETIRVMPDGAVHFQTVFEGDAQDVRNGDPLPDESGPWTVTDRLKVDEDGKETLTRTAVLEVEPGRPLPDRYCPDDADAARWALQMPTTLRIERRGANIYYHFKRIYLRRDWAFIDYHRQEFLQEELEALEDKEFADLDEHHQQSIARALLGFEAAKALALAQAALIELEPLLHQEQQLAVHRGIRSVFESIDAQRIVEVLQMDGEQADQSISLEVQQVQGQIESAIQAALSQTDPSGRLARIVVAELDQQRLGHSISEDLQDDAWEVYLQLPGRLIGHNGDTTEDGTVKWEFGGNALCDRDQVLMATSVVAADP